MVLPDSKTLYIVTTGWRNGKPLWEIMFATGIKTASDCMDVVRYLQLSERSPTTCEIFLPEEPAT